MAPHIFFIFHGRFPSEKAAALFATESAFAFAQCGTQVTLVAPRRIGRMSTTPRPFTTVYLPTLDVFWIPIVKGAAFYISLFVFSVSSFFYLLFTAHRNDSIYSNESLPLLLASFCFSQTCFELHDYPERSRWYWNILFRRVKHILVTNEIKMKRLAQEFPDAARKAFVEQNAVGLEEFSLSLSKQEARKELILPQSVYIALYTGHLYGWKGVDTLAKAAQQQPKLEVYFVGGTQEDSTRFRAKWEKVKNIHVVGHRPHAEIPLWQKAADVLVLPNTARDPVSRESTSPMKLFEYMASERPVVASNLPSIAEILSHERGILVEADNPKALAQGIQKALTDAESPARAKRARAWVEDHTWEKRAKRILEHIN